MDLEVLYFRNAFKIAVPRGAWFALRLKLIESDENIYGTVSVFLEMSTFDVTPQSGGLLGK